MKNLKNKFSIEVVFITLLFFSGFWSNLNGQTTKRALSGDTLFLNEQYSLRYYMGVMNVNCLSLKQVDDIQSVFNLRLGILSKYNFTRNFGVKFNTMGNFSNANSFGFSEICLYYNPGNFSFVAGKSASPITSIRPYPISFYSQAEFFSTMILGSNKYTINASYSIGDKLNLKVGAAEFGRSFGDSTQYSFRLDYSGFSVGAYTFTGADLNVKKEIGIVAAYNSDAFEMFASCRKQLVSSYIRIMFDKKHALNFVTDFVYDYSHSKKFGKECDYLEILLLQSFDLGKVIQNKVEGLYGLGVNDNKYLTVYLGVHF
jgi:hypothetical protein